MNECFVLCVVCLFVCDCQVVRCEVVGWLRNSVWLNRCLIEVLILGCSVLMICWVCLICVLCLVIVFRLLWIGWVWGMFDNVLNRVVKNFGVLLLFERWMFLWLGFGLI